MPPYYATEKRAHTCQRSRSPAMAQHLKSFSVAQYGGMVSYKG